MYFSENKIEIESFSWCMYENNVAKKIIDKTLVKEYSTGVPIDIVKFFTQQPLVKGERFNLKISLNNLLLPAYIERKKDGRHRLNIKEIKKVTLFCSSDISINSIWFEKSDEQADLFHLFIDSNDQKVQEVKSTYKISSLKTRVGQHVFKAKLIDKWDNKCAVTGVVEHTPSILIASHIKSWAESNDVERLDGNNGLLLSPHIDKLFDTYRITISSISELVIAKNIDDSLLKAWNIKRGTQIKLDDNQQYYMDYHRCKFDKLSY